MLVFDEKVFLIFNRSKVIIQEDMMKIGLRTLKTVVSATLGIVIANYFGLMFPATSGIVAILSVTNTKKSSFKIGIGRLVAFVVATLIALFTYHLLGYTALAFGLFLLLFIPIAAKWQMPEAIPVNSVLMTHFLNEQSMSPYLIANAFFLLLIGVSLALVANLYMPNKEAAILENKVQVDETIQLLLKQLGELLMSPHQTLKCDDLFKELSQEIKQGRTLAKQDLENKLLNQDSYLLNYFNMRKHQFNTLEDMYQLIQNIRVEEDIAMIVNELLIDISKSYSEANDALGLKQQVLDVFQIYELKPLPTSRVEFENRAKLYQLLLTIQSFIDIKVNFFELNQK